jgi:hypothetical protein
MLSWLMYWHNQKKMLRVQMRHLQYNRWQRSQHPAFRHPKTRWSMVKTL